VVKDPSVLLDAAAVPWPPVCIADSVNVWIGLHMMRAAASGWGRHKSLYHMVFHQSHMIEMSYSSDSSLQDPLPTSEWVVSRHGFPHAQFEEPVNPMYNPLLRGLANHRPTSVSVCLAADGACILNQTSTVLIQYFTDNGHL
jgi:hypothetical protein